MKIISAILSLVLMLSLLAGCAKSESKDNSSETKAYDDTPVVSVDTEAADQEKEDDIVNIALFGVDSRNAEVFTGLSDSIMILSLNKSTKTVKIFSVMRDTLVPMYDDESNRFFGKINSAYKHSPERAIRTLNQVFKLDIEDFATVNFFGMADIIDAFGGIEATITEDELKWQGENKPNLNNCMDEICREKGLDPNNYYIKNSGKQTLNGVQAVAYSRIRQCTSVWGTTADWGRTDRQRHVMQELFNKAKNMGSDKCVSLVNKLVTSVRTSLKTTEIIDLAVNVLGESSSFEQYRIPQNDMTFKGPAGYGSIIYFDVDYAAEMMDAIIYDDVTMEEFIAENPIEKNDWYKEMNQ